jgi:hypothetical protein
MMSVLREIDRKSGFESARSVDDPGTEVGPWSA